LAGTRARALCAYEQAVTALLAAKSLLEEQPPDPTQLAQMGQVVEQLAPAYRSTLRQEAAQRLLEDYIALCEEQRYGRGIARGCTLLGLFLQVSPALASVETIRAQYERAIEVCEAYGLDDWIVYPQARLAWVLVDSGADVERAEALVNACLPEAAA